MPDKNDYQYTDSNQTSYFSALAGGLGTALSAPFAVVGYTLSNMAASRTSFDQIRRSIAQNPFLLFASTGRVFAKLSLASTRVLVMPYANQAVQVMPESYQDWGTAAFMSIAELPSAAAELFEIQKSSQATYRQLKQRYGNTVAQNARLLVNVHSPRTWGLFFACTMLKNYPLNYVAARHSRIANEESQNTKREVSSEPNTPIRRVISATGHLFFSATVAGSFFQGPLYRSARGYSGMELLRSIANTRNIAVGLCKGLAHIPIGIFTFGLMEAARAYERNRPHF